MTNITLTTNFATATCSWCHFVFAMPETFLNDRRDDHKTFYCPSCCKGTWFPQESDIERLETKLADCDKTHHFNRKEVQALERSNSALKGHITRLQKKLKG